MSDKAYLSELHLGKSQPYVDQYDVSLLQAIPRALSRSELDLPETFFGEDVWTAYEVSWLNNKGKPCVAIAECGVPANSAAIVESKSFKYYLNSLNQTVFNSENDLKNRLEEDISACVQAPVSFTLWTPDDFAARRKQSYDNTLAQKALNVDKLDIEVDVYAPTSSLLSSAGGCSKPVSGIWCSHLLKSNCPVTGQPDWASVWVGMEGAAVTAESLLRYIISFRQHQDFHENCVERIFSDILKVVEPAQLWVYARYTRRGGLDINPLRCLQPMLRPECSAGRQ